MAKTLRTSSDYTVKAGAGYDSGSGTNTIRLDARYVRIPGDLTIEGTQTVVDSQSLTVEDQFIEVNRNNSTAGTEDSGIFFNQGSSNNQVLYYDADQAEFVMGSTTHDATVSAISNITPGKIRILTGSESDQAATKGYVDAQVGGASAVGDLTITGSTIATPSNADLTLTPGGTGAVDMGAIRIRDNHIEGTRSNDDILIQPAGTGAVVIQDVLTFEANSSDPTAGSITKIYSKTVSGGGTGVFFNNSAVSSGAAGELISKKKATALAIALG